MGYYTPYCNVATCNAATGSLFAEKLVGETFGEIAKNEYLCNPINIRYMKHIKMMAMPDCQKLIYSGGMIARQIGAMFVVDDEEAVLAESYPIIGGGLSNADGSIMPEECMRAKMVCRVGEKITPKRFAEFVKMGMHEEIPATAWDLYHQLRENGSDLRLPVWAKDGEPVREYDVELEFHDFKEEACCYSTDTSDFFFEVYYNREDKDDVYNQLNGQLMDYMNILDREDLGCKIIFNTVDLRYSDVIKRLNETPIDTIYCDMREPR